MGAAYNLADVSILVHVDQLKDCLEVLLCDGGHGALLLHPLPAQRFDLVHDFLNKKDEERTNTISLYFATRSLNLN